MKTRLLLFGFLISFNYMVLAQDASTKNAVSFSMTWLDHYSPELKWLNGDFAQYDKLTQGATIGYTRWLNRSLNLNIPLRLATADLALDAPDGKNNASWLNLDAVLQLKLLDDSHLINPYLMGGIGGVWTDWEKWYVQTPLGMGLNIRLTPGLFINTQAEYRIALNSSIDNMHFLAGLKFHLGSGKVPPVDTDGDGIPDTEDDCPLEAGPVSLKGCPDRDGDGIVDKDDRCPDVAGPINLKGCPDRDKDGIADIDDECPDEAGLARFNGCPDKDNDGVPDKDDRCPDVAGPVNLKGCPDRDNDNVPDIDDKCPDVPGPASNNGCPLDRDGDGVPDDMDKCPDEAGPASNKGCPELKEEEKAIVTMAIQNVQFETNSANLTQVSFGILDQLITVLNNNKAYSCDIAGHTDSTGDPALNQTLSEQRAKACFDYLVSKGIDAKRLSHAGFGETKPIADNNTAAGRKANRRTEFILTVK